MADIRRVTETYAVAPQIDEDDFASIAAEGYNFVINNRPDGETFGQMPGATAQSGAAAAGMKYAAVPVSGAPTMTAVDETIAIMAANQGPILAYCRSGTRSCTVWALAAVKSGAETPESALTKAREAGYDLSHMNEVLASLAAG